MYRKYWIIGIFLCCLGLSNCVTRKQFLSLKKEVESLRKALEDDDADGVINLYDKESDTPEGIPIDSNGRTLDSDNDGYPDNEDGEPFTPQGCDVDDNGVAIDADKDGVPDCVDKEPNSPPGMYYDAKGVSIQMVQENTGGSYTDDYINSLSFPVFKLPPPPYSKIEKYSVEKAFPSQNRLADIDSVLAGALLKAGFKDKYNKPRFNYYQIKMDDRFRGFAVVTDFEKINLSGVPKSDRFNLEVNKKKHKSILDYIFPTSLNQGYFRFFAILVTDNYFGDRTEPLTKNEALEQLMLGAKELHPVIKEQSIYPQTQIHILVYEYNQSEADQDGQPTELDGISVDQHLLHAGIKKLLNLQK